jgi:hypothetical protein
MHPAEQFDPKRLALATMPSNGKPAAAIGKGNRPSRRRGGEGFLKGPIPWPWLCIAARLRGKALVTAIVIWHLAGLRRKLTVQWEPHKAESFRLGRHAAYRGLTALERVGLVAVERHRGRCPIITILPHPRP